MYLSFTALVWPPLISQTISQLIASPKTRVLSVHTSKFAGPRRWIGSSQSSFKEHKVLLALSETQIQFLN